MDDITFCLSDCQRTDCFRHPSNIQDRTIPHSYADFKETETCPEFAKDINVPINDDTISRQSIIDTIHKTICGFFDVAEDDSEEPISEKDKLLLEVNKAICNGIKELPSVQPEHLVKKTGNLVKGLVNDCISRQAAIEAIDAVFPVDPMKSEYAQGIACGAALAKTYVEQLPSAQPEHTETHSCDCECTETHDLVSRQAAIDSVCEVCENCEYFKNEKLIQTIKDLPSAQPEHLVKESGNLVKGLVNDCISRQAAIDALEEPRKVPDTWTDEYAVGERMQWEKDVKALNSLPSVQPQRWIPVTEALPEDYVDVLVWFEYFRYGNYNCLYQTWGIGDYSEEYGSWMVNHESGWRKLRVIAWMPLPEPWRGGQNETN